MSRTDGRKLVALAAAATVGALGIGTIYLPFMADRDKLRGMYGMDTVIYYLSIRFHVRCCSLQTSMGQLLIIIIITLYRTADLNTYTLSSIIY